MVTWVFSIFEVFRTIVNFEQYFILFSLLHLDFQSKGDTNGDKSFETKAWRGSEADHSSPILC